MLPAPANQVLVQSLTTFATESGDASGPRAAAAQPWPCPAVLLQCEMLVAHHPRLGGQPPAVSLRARGCPKRVAAAGLPSMVTCRLHTVFGLLPWWRDVGRAGFVARARLQFVLNGSAFRTRRERMWGAFFAAERIVFHRDRQASSRRQALDCGVPGIHTFHTLVPLSALTACQSEAAFFQAFFPLVPHDSYRMAWPGVGSTKQDSVMQGKKAKTMNATS